MESKAPRNRVACFSSANRWFSSHVCDRRREHRLSHVVYLQRGFKYHRRILISNSRLTLFWFYWTISASLCNILLYWNACCSVQFCSVPCQGTDWHSGRMVSTGPRCSLSHCWTSSWRHVATHSWRDRKQVHSVSKRKRIFRANYLKHPCKVNRFNCLYFSCIITEQFFLIKVKKISSCSLPMVWKVMPYYLLWGTYSTL